MLKQVVKINGLYNIDRNNNFGGRASGGLWGAFFGLVLWIATFVYGISDLFAWVDDCYTFGLASDMVWYEKYQVWYPRKQARLLELWDRLGIPHDRLKQVWGSVLTIIGFEVDVNAMTIRMPDISRLNLIHAIEEFAVLGRRPKLSDYQALAGWINWALNTYPYLRPCLSQLYKKISGKSQASREIYVNKAVVRELCWAANHLKTCDSLFLLSSLDWTEDNADFILLTDACLFGMGFWSPAHRHGFQSNINAGNHTIFYWEAYTVYCAFHWLLHSVTPPPRRVVIYCDNSNAVALFQSLCASPDLNPIVLSTADLMIRFNCQLCLVHISGEQNVVADALSRFDNARARQYQPALAISFFQPPPLILGYEGD